MLQLIVCGQSHGVPPALHMPVCLWCMCRAEVACMQCNDARFAMLQSGSLPVLSTIRLRAVVLAVTGREGPD